MRTRQFELSKSSSAVRTRPLTLLRAHGLELDLQNELQLELEHESDLEFTSPSNAHSKSNHHARTRLRTRTGHRTQTCARARNPRLAELPLHFFPGHGGFKLKSTPTEADHCSETAGRRSGHGYGRLEATGGGSPPAFSPDRMPPRRPTPRSTRLRISPELTGTSTGHLRSQDEEDGPRGRLGYVAG